MENLELKKIYDKLERNVLILIAIPIPFFAVAYLNSQNGTFSLDLPEVPAFWNSFSLGFVYVGLALHYIDFHSSLKKIISSDWNLEEKVKKYASATMHRFWILFISALVCSVGLLLFDNPGYTIAFAITLVFCSLGKPTPDRIIRLLKLKGEERQEIELLKRRG
ncbi:hypothetical protein [Cecembia rubra]|uniref:Uncharacterized protein n=1 Tax=Cecembia rubra TaxID=1485585 RepID=A0A2P8EAD5_9BACT|nr:hypothetical protein [Cecembia rubra]PSL06415.1 hypothetical protein CLV48_102231 [Cecembia rubra]